MESVHSGDRAKRSKYKLPFRNVMAVSGTSLSGGTAKKVFTVPSRRKRRQRCAPKSSNQARGPNAQRTPDHD